MKMKKCIYRGVVWGMLLFSGFFSGCNKEVNPLADGYGYLQLDFSRDDGEIVVEAKSGEAVAAQVRSEADPVFSVKILNEQGVIVKSCEDHRELEKNPLKLKAGTYYVKAVNGTDKEAAFDNPFYEGTDTLSVIPGGVARGSVVCRLSNVKVTIQLDQSVTEQFSSYVVSVSNSEGNRGLIFDPEMNTLDREGYFCCTGRLMWALNLTNNNGTAFDALEGVIENVQPREHYKLKFKVSDTEADGGGNIRVELNPETNDIEHNITVSLNKKPKPEYKTNGFDLSQTQLISLGTAPVYRISAEVPAGLKSFIVSHGSAELQEAGIPAEFNPISLPASDAASVNAGGITWSGATEGSTNLILDFSVLLGKLPLGDYSVGLSAWDKQFQKRDTVFRFTVIPSVETNAVGADPWAKHAVLQGRWNTVERPAGLRMEYKKADASQWIEIRDGFTEEQNLYSYKVTGLEPATEYYFRTASDKEVSNEISFTTEQALQIPNMGFDAWFSKKQGLATTWYPNADLSGENFWWDSGNEGANKLSAVNPTTGTDHTAVSGEGKQAAKLESKSVFGILAAGSIYLGDFGATIGTSGAHMTFGRPYTCRPLAMKGYFDYTPAEISSAQEPYASLKGQSDMCQIYVVLADWGSPYYVNTSEKIFIDPVNDDRIIAYGEMTVNSATGGYLPFTIPLEYRNNRKPTHCVIVASSSKYGDYFTGGEGSVLYVDEFEFIFDENEIKTE